MDYPFLCVHASVFLIISSLLSVTLSPSEK